MTSLFVRRRGILGSIPTSVPFTPEGVVGARAAWVADDASAVGDGNPGSSWVDRVGGFDAAQSDGAKQAIWLASGINGQPAFDFNGIDDLFQYTAANAVSTATSGHVFLVARADVLDATVRTWWMTADTASNGSYLFLASQGASPNLRIQQNGNAEPLTTLKTPDSSLAATTDYLIELNSTGTALECRINNSVQSLTVSAGSNDGDWFADCPNRDGFTIGGFKHNVESTGIDGKIGTLLVTDGHQADRSVFDSFFASVTAKYGITLA